MSVSQYTAEELIEMIRTRGGFPDAATEGTTDTDLLSFLNAEALALYGKIASCHEDYFTVTDRVAITAGKQKYRIPHRAMFGKVRDIGSVLDGVPYKMEPTSRENVADYFSTDAASVPSGFYVESMYICFVPTLTAGSGYIDIAYLFRPGQLVLSTDCRQIDSVDTTTGVVTLTSAAPTSWTTALKYDIHSSLSGAEPKNWSISTSAFNVARDEMTFTPSDLTGSTTGRFEAEEGDWLCLEEQAALPGLPRELHPILAHSVVCRVLERKDKEAFMVSRAELQSMMKDVQKILAMRVEGKVQNIATYNTCFFGR